MEYKKIKTVKCNMKREKVKYQFTKIYYTIKCTKNKSNELQALACQDIELRHANVMRLRTNDVVITCHLSFT